MKFILTLSLFFALLSCSQKENEEPKHDFKQIYSLKNSQLFNYIDIKSYLHFYDKKNNRNNQELFLKGLDFYKNKNNLDSAKYFFKQSLLNYPENQAYYQLGNVFLDQGKYNEAIKSYEMAERLGYEPFSNVLYNMACIYSLKKDEALAGKYLEYAIQAGYANIDHIYKDKDLAFLRESSYLFKSHVDNALKGVGNPEQLAWIQFKKQFPSKALPLALKEEMPLVLNEETRLSYDFEPFIAEMRDEKFSREVSKGFYYYAKVKENANYTALVYLVKEEYYGDQSPVGFRIVTFDNNGKIIDKKEIAGRFNFSKTQKTATIDKNDGIKVKEFALTYENDPEMNGYYDNKIKTRKKIKEVHFLINSFGKIQAKTLALK